jgi:hypothetical protein
MLNDMLHRRVTLTKRQRAYVVLAPAAMGIVVLISTGSVVIGCAAALSGLPGALIGCWFQSGRGNRGERAT